MRFGCEFMARNARHGREHTFVEDASTPQLQVDHAAAKSRIIVWIRREGHVGARSDLSPF
jgi:hypothetical protein